MREFCRKIVTNPWFDRTIIVLILLNAVVLGLETSPELVSRYGDTMILINQLVLAVFVLEAVMKITAVAPRFGLYFGDGWNLFDFTIVVLSLIPATGEFAMIARLARLMRVMRLVSALPELRLIVATLIRSIPGFANVILLLSIIFYIYAVAGYHIFHEHDPVHWRNLGISLLTLFRVLTLEDWTDVMYTAMQLNPYSWLFFVSFVVVATFVVINLFIAVVINNLEAAKQERLIRQGETTLDSAQRELRATQESLSKLASQLDRLQQKEY
ncbi:MAG: ion transporter [Arenicellales bacterium]|nr:ion transporter [Arenicellales bacterium]